MAFLTSSGLAPLTREIANISNSSCSYMPLRRFLQLLSLDPRVRPSARNQEAIRAPHTQRQWSGAGRSPLGALANAFRCAYGFGRASRGFRPRCHGKVARICGGCGGALQADGFQQTRRRRALDSRSKLHAPARWTRALQSLQGGFCFAWALPLRSRSGGWHGVTRSLCASASRGRPRPGAYGPRRQERVLLCR